MLSVSFSIIGLTIKLIYRGIISKLTRSYTLIKILIKVFFVYRAKKMIKNLVTYAKSQGMYCETGNRPKYGTYLKIWR